MLKGLLLKCSYSVIPAGELNTSHFPAEMVALSARIFLLRAGANAFGCNTEKLLPLNALAG
ncbi:hypothetical protein C8P63_11499 [Melghirimyces profundicolus]|uniref:Uncharacterized protein n=1 Tax=Melghirimyces profundicolus TaxID=1242148 RepID=A0A2T6BSJ5_9BACL|nr:hypothetical protein C8P63_11499 [Melghirimyces profundicolus]